MPDAMLMTASRSACEDWVVRNCEADTGNSLEVKDPGMSTISNCGAFSNEFYDRISFSILGIVLTSEGRRRGMW
jgi:hypothetical protein